MEKRQFRTLFRLFLFRLVDVELLSSHAQGDSQRLLGQLAAMLIFVSVLLTFPALSAAGISEPLRQLLLAWSIQHFLIATTMLAVGIFAVLSWESTFPDKRDAMVLRALPVKARTIFLSKVAASAAALGLTVAALHALPGLAWPIALHSGGKVELPSMTWLAPPPAQDIDTLATALQRDIHLPRNPNASLAVAIQYGGQRRVLTFGSARPDSLFPIGSVSKTFTALALARMAARGEVALDTPVSDVMQLDRGERPITLLDLATHYSGLPPLPSNLSRHGDPNPGADYGDEQLRQYLSKRPLSRPVEPTFGYSNLGFGLLGQALARRAGLSYEELIAREITRPLGLSDTVLSRTQSQHWRTMQGFDAKWKPVPLWVLDSLAPAGAILSTPEDLLRYLETHLHPPAGFEQATQMAAEQRRAVFGNLTIGLGWIHDRDTGVYWHNGAIGGFTSYVFLHRANGYAAAVLFNQGVGQIPFVELVGNHVRQRLAHLPAMNLEPVTIPARHGFFSLLRQYFAYWATMILAAAFVFCSVLAVQGLAAQILSRRLFLRLSPALQVALFVLLVAGYFLQPALAHPGAISEAQGSGLLRYSPSYWFLGLLQQLSGSPAMAMLAQRAWMALGLALAAVTVAYAWSYARSLHRIVEEPDLPPARSSAWIATAASPVWAMVHFAARTLLRSARHRMILAFYLGLGFAITVVLMKAPHAPPTLLDGPPPNPWREASTPMVAATIAMVLAWIAGVRVAFALPVDLRANWIFRITGMTAATQVAWRALVLLSLAPAWLMAAVLCGALWPWREAAGHLALLGLAGLIACELSLTGFRKIPFTCAYLPGKSYVHLAVLGALGLMWVVVLSARHERTILGKPYLLGGVLAIFALAFVCARWVRVRSSSGDVEYEEAPEVLGLGLSG